MIGQEEETLGTLVHEVAHSLRLLIDKQVEPYNLTRAKWLALGILDREGQITPTELADALELDKSTVARLIGRLEARGFICREKDPEDGRAYRIVLCDEARPLLGELEQVADDVRIQAVRGLTEGEQDQLLHLLGRVKGNLLTAREKV